MTDDCRTCKHRKPAVCRRCRYNPENRQAMQNLLDRFLGGFCRSDTERAEMQTLLGIALADRDRMRQTKPDATHAETRRMLSNHYASLPSRDLHDCRPIDTC